MKLQRLCMVSRSRCAIDYNMRIIIHPYDSRLLFMVMDTSHSSSSSLLAARVPVAAGVTLGCFVGLLLHSGHDNSSQLANAQGFWPSTTSDPVAAIRVAVRHRARPVNRDPNRERYPKVKLEQKGSDVAMATLLKPDKQPHPELHLGLKQRLDRHSMISPTMRILKTNTTMLILLVMASVVGLFVFLWQRSTQRGLNLHSTCATQRPLKHTASTILGPATFMIASQALAMPPPEVMPPTILDPPSGPSLARCPSRSTGCISSRSCNLSIPTLSLMPRHILSHCMHSSMHREPCELGSFR